MAFDSVPVIPSFTLISVTESEIDIQTEAELYVQDEGHRGRTVRRIYVPGGILRLQDVSSHRTNLSVAWNFLDLRCHQLHMFCVFILPITRDRGQVTRRDREPLCRQQASHQHQPRPTYRREMTEGGWVGKEIGHSTCEGWNLLLWVWNVTGWKSKQFICWKTDVYVRLYAERFLTIFIHLPTNRWIIFSLRRFWLNEIKTYADELTCFSSPLLSHLSITWTIYHDKLTIWKSHWVSKVNMSK